MCIGEGLLIVDARRRETVNPREIHLQFSQLIGSGDGRVNLFLKNIIQPTK